MCKVQHLWGRSVDVDGVVVAVPTDGIVRGVDPTAAATLLQDKTGWAVLVSASVGTVDSGIIPPLNFQNEVREPESSVSTPAAPLTRRRKG